MSIRLEDSIAKLPKEEREAIEKRAQELIDEVAKEMNDIINDPDTDEDDRELAKATLLEATRDTSNSGNDASTNQGSRRRS